MGLPAASNPLPDLAPPSCARHVLRTLLLRIDDLEKRIGDRTLFTGANAVLRAQDRIGIVGPNGAGKSTLLRVLIGDEPHDGGRIHIARAVRMGMLRQEIDPRADHSVREEAASALAELDLLESELRDLEVEMSRGAERGEALSDRLTTRYDEVSVRFEHGGGFERHARVAEVLSGLGFSEDAIDRPLSSFSGGWLMRVELAKLLLAAPEILLLDEPTNHLDLPSIRFFESTIERFPGAVLVVSHDRTFLERHTNRIIDIDGLGGFQLYEGSYQRYVEQREQRRAELLARKANQDRQIAETERFVERFRAKATKARQAQSRLKALDKLERIEAPSASRRTMRLKIPEPTRSGERVLTLSDLHKRFGDEVLYAGVNFTLGRGEKVALVGPNGAGKSTLLRIAADALAFEAGERTLGHKVDFSFFAQHQLEALDSNATVLEELTLSAKTAEIPRLRGHLGAFLFQGDEVDKSIGVLSGGEKARVALAKLLLRPANLLILDEPTNHLDIEACEILEEALSDFPGTLLFVSHDRSFINAIASRIVEVDQGQLEDHLGDYDAYEARKLRREKDASDAGGAAEKVAAERTEADALASRSPGEMSHKERRQFEREQRKRIEKIDRRIAKLETEISDAEQELESLDVELAQPEVYQDHERTRNIQGAQTSLRQKIDLAYGEWEKLGEERATLDESLGSGS